MTTKSIDSPRACWCAESKLQPFSADYQVCTRCGTLVSLLGLTAEECTVRDDQSDFYGRSYWLRHQVEDLGLYDIFQRIVMDLPERCLEWLKVLLSYQAPPGRLLELGSAHGGFVAVCQWAGYDVTGLEVSPWVVEFARKTFGVPMLLGRLEEQALGERSLSAIASFYVMEHFPQPVQTIRRCAELLRDDGILFLQTPRFPEGKSYADLTAAQHPFLFAMNNVAGQHLYLFSERSMRRLLAEAGLTHVQFEAALFPHDMSLVAGKQPLRKREPREVEARLLGSPSGRLMHALLDQRARLLELQRQSQEDQAKANAALEQLRAENARLGHELQEAGTHTQQHLALIHEKLASLDANLGWLRTVRKTWFFRLGKSVFKQKSEVRGQRSAVSSQPVSDL